MSTRMTSHAGKLPNRRSEKETLIRSKSLSSTADSRFDWCLRGMLLYLPKQRERCHNRSLRAVSGSYATVLCDFALAVPPHLQRG
jgi:hypothetical protein